MLFPARPRPQPYFLKRPRLVYDCGPAPALQREGGLKRFRVSTTFSLFCVCVKCSTSCSWTPCKVLLLTRVPRAAGLFMFPPTQIRPNLPLKWVLGFGKPPLSPPLYLQIVPKISPYVYSIVVHPVKLYVVPTPKVSLAAYMPPSCYAL